MKRYGLHLNCTLKETVSNIACASFKTNSKVPKPIWCWTNLLKLIYARLRIRYTKGHWKAYHCTCQKFLTCVSQAVPETALHYKNNWKFKLCSCNKTLTPEAYFLYSEMANYLPFINKIVDTASEKNNYSLSTLVQPVAKMKEYII